MKFKKDIKKDLQKTFDENLNSVYIYGSALNQNLKKNKDINMLILLNENNFKKLEKLSSFFNRWKKILKTTPLLFDINYLKTSLDVYPIEFSDIKYNHNTLLGEDIFENLNIPTNNLRLQIEQEIKGNLVHLESKYMLNYKDDKKLLNLILKGFSSYSAIFRNILRLLDENVKDRKYNIEKTSELLNFKKDPFLKMLDIKEKKIKIKNVNIHKLFNSFYEEATSIAESIDKLEV